jgi:multidrug resistance efflux pump
LQCRDQRREEPATSRWKRFMAPLNQRELMVDRSETGANARKHPALLRMSAIGVAGLLSVLMLTAVAPPIVADQTDRAVINAPVTLLTAPISGEIGLLAARPGREVHDGDTLAQISNPRLDRGTLISLQEKASDARQKLGATRAKHDSDLAYVASLDGELASQTNQLKAQFQSQIEELRARVAQSKAMSGEKKALVDRQNNMVTRSAASIEMVKPTTEQYAAAVHNADAEVAKLNQKIAQLNALDRGIYVGDELVALNNLAQKRRDIDLDARRMKIDEKQQSAVLADLEHLIDAEQKRLATLADADVLSRGQGRVLTVGAAMGRHVSAGDTISSVIDCDKRFVVAIFSYRQGQSMMPGTRVRIDGGSLRSGVVSAVLPKTSDKVDERFAVPFPQTERRELYAIITPDGASEDGATVQQTGTSEAPACPVGQWVTVTRDDGIVPSMSVNWRRLSHFVASWFPNDPDNTGTMQNVSLNADIRRDGITRLHDAFRASKPQAPEAGDDRLPTTRVSR